VNQYAKKLLEISIDFDDASNCWRENKIARKNGCFVYKCERMTKKGNPCNNKCILYQNYCKKHIQLNNSLPRIK